MMKGAKWRALFCFIAAIAAGCFAAACAEEHVHEYEAVVTPPTCTEQGYTTYTCPEDGESYVDDYVEPLGHTPAAAVRENETAATCTEAGSYEEAVYCAVCGTELSRRTVETEALGHEWDEGTLTTAPTCTQDGVRTFRCTRCSEGKTETAAATGHIPGPEATCTQAQVCLQCDAVLTEALGHDWDEGTTEQEATCLQEGSVLYACSRCDEVRRESTPKGAHMPETVPGKDATCTDDGLTEGSKCSVCGTVLKEQEEIPAKGHTPSEAKKENEKAATCTEEGSYDEVVICSVCGVEISREQVKVEKAAHTWVENTEEGYLVSAATCIAQAVYYKSCSACGANSEETFAYGEFAAHTPETVLGKDATCTDDGLTEGSKCSVCGTVLKEQEEIPAKGHTPSEAKKENEKAATCTEEGSYDEVVICSVCGEEISRKQVTVDKAAHTWVENAEEGYLVSAATCTAQAVYYKSCSACGTKSEETFAYGELASHTPVTVPGKDATCTDDGLTEGSKCSVCGTVLKEQEEIPAKGHTPSEAKKENEKAATCTEEGSYDEVVICSVCGVEISREQVKVEKAAHTWVENTEEGYLVSAATCIAQAVYYKSCSACGAKGTETFEYGEFAAHTPETVPGKAATCFAPGLTEGSKCSVCGEVITEQQKIEALSHTFNGNAVCSVCGGIDMSKPEKGSGSTVAVHDPSVIIAYADSYGIVYPEDGDGRQKVYFVFGTQLAAAYSFDMESWVAFTPTFYEEGTTTVSTDHTKIFASAAAWPGYADANTIKGNLWAPDIIYNTKLEKWCLYYSMSGDSSNFRSSVFMMTADKLTGPYVFKDFVVFSGFNKGTGAGVEDYKKVTGESSVPERYSNDKGAWNNNYGVSCIDPAVLYDEAGDLWMFYGSWSGGIFLLKLDNETGLRDTSRTYGSGGQPIYDTEEKTALREDPYLGIHVAGGWYVSGEGPYVEYIDGYYYLFLSYGFYSPDGGYNMRVFRAKDITGDYVDPDGTWAVYGERNGNNYGADVSHGLSFMQNYKWSWWTGPASIAQGHNSVLTDDGNVYLVYHIKYDDGTIQHNVEVHRLVEGKEGGWYLVAPFQKSEHDRIVTDAEEADLAGGWSILIHKPIANYGAMAYNTDVAVTLNADGTVSGVYNGTWSVSGQYITIELEGEGTFNGVLMEQQIEGIDGEQLTYTFTAMNENGLCVWGARFTDELAAQLMADRITFPDTILGDLDFEMQGLWGTTIAYSSSDTTVLANDGKFTAPATDTELTLTVTVSIGSASISRTKEFTIKGLSEDSIKEMLPEPIADDGYLVKAEPGAGGSIAPIGELSNYTGVSFTFRVKDVKTDWDVMFRTANGTQVYLSVLNYKNVNIFEASATLSEEGEQFLTENGYGVTGFNHVIFLDEVEANQENGSVATISYNVDGSIAFYRNGVLMLTYAADTEIGTGTVSDLVRTMVAQVRTQGLSVVYPVSNVIIGYAADYDENKVPEERPVEETLGKDNGDGTYDLGFNTWEPSLIKEVTGDFKVVYDFNVKAPSNTTAGNGIYYLNWIVKIGNWVLRSDYYSMDAANNFADVGSAVSYSAYIDWSDYCEAYRDADVILTIQRTGVKVVVTADVTSLWTGDEFTYTATYANFGPDNTTVSLGGQNCLINVYNVTTESGEGPVEPEFPMAYPAMPDVAETGLSVSFTLANAVYEAGDPDSTWNALLSAGGYVITFGNLDAYSTTGALTGMNLYPSNSQFGGANWDGLFGQGTIKVTIDITKDSIVFYRNGMPIIQYVREGGLQAEIDFVGPFIDAFLAEVAENGFTFAEVAYDITNVVVGTVQETDFEVGTTDNSTGYTGNTPLWKSTIQKGQKITVTGTATSSGAGQWNSPFAYLWTGDTASLDFRADNFLNGVDEGNDQSGTEANVTGFNFHIAKTWQGFDPATANGSDWVASLISHYQQEFTCTITWDYSEANKIVVQYSFKWEDATFNQQYTITPQSDDLLESYSIGLGVDCAYYHVTGMTVE